MKKKFKVTLVVFLVVVLGCFSQVFAATNQNNKADKISQVRKNARFLQSASTDNGVVGTSNLNGTADNSAKVGNQLTAPEIGWKRYDDSNSGFTYGGNDWVLDNTHFKNSYNGTAYVAGDHYGINNICNGNETVTFQFYGSKIRIVGLDASDNNWSTNIQISIDGINYSYSNKLNSLGCLQTLLFEKNNLELGIHTIAITNKTTTQMEFDCIDIDSTGYLIDPSSTLATGITLNKTTDLLNVNGTDTLIATVTPDNATNKTVKWTSSDPTVISVDANGNITALKAGTATITATTTDASNLSASCIVTVSEPAETTTISLNKVSDLIDIGGNDILAAEVSPSNIGVTWSSSDDSIVTVDADGKIIGIKAGTAIITATTVDGKKVSCTVNVKDKETGKSKLTLYMNDNTIREFYLTQDEIDDFIDWYTLKIKGEATVQPYYVFNISVPEKSATKKSYVWFMKIESFEVE